MDKHFNNRSHEHKPAEIASQCSKKALQVVEQEGSAVIVMGEHHHRLSHQVTEAVTVKSLTENHTSVTMFIELPHDRLRTLLIDRGYSREDAKALYKHMSEHDSNGHILAKGIIGGNVNSIGGGLFQSYECQVSLQAAIVNNARIICVDAARCYPNDHCLDYFEPSTNDVVIELDARQGNANEMGPDDMLIRNTHMAKSITNNLGTGDVAVLVTGAAHVFGIEDKENGFHTYEHSLARILEGDNTPTAIMLSMPPPISLPHDYDPAPAGEQRLFLSPQPSTPTDKLSDEEVIKVFEENGLDFEAYNPGNFVEQYRVEFNQALAKAEKELGIEGPKHHLNLQTIPPRLNTPTYCPFD